MSQKIKDYSADDFADAVDGLSDEVVIDATYVEAAMLGRDAVPNWRAKPIDAHAVGTKRAAQARQFAVAMQRRVAVKVADELTRLADEEASHDEIMAGIGQTLDSLTSDVTRYAEPPWSAGNEAYGSQLGEFGVSLDWVLDDDVINHCDDCPELADGSPYDPGDIPTWPGQGDTACLDNCHCEIHADEESWAEAFG